MEFVLILRLAWRRRLALAAGVVLGLAVGLLLARGESGREGVASTRLVLDTPVSQFVVAAPKGADSLGWRTELLAHLLTTEQARERIARDARVPLSKLVVISPLLNTPVLPTTLPRRASAVAVATTSRYVITVLADGGLPIISLQGRAPSGEAARRLVAAAAAELKAAGALPPDDSGTQPFVVQDAGSILAVEVAVAGRKKLAAAASLVVLLLWGAAVLIAPAALARLGRGRRVRRSRVA